MKINCDEYTRLTIDRFEGNSVVCETASGASLELDLELVDPKAKEGDVIVIDNSTGMYVCDRPTTNAKRERAVKLQNKMFEQK